ncbi:MAG: hypothetical protein PHW34_08445 [Hespellia sp.]|nr:hypothetical protein [Hespellia sp.]
MEDGGRAISYNYNNVNQLLSKVDSLSEEQYRYDKRGNLSQIVENGQIKNQYVYGALNRLEQAVNNKGEAAKYQYNGLGHRVGKSVGHAGFQEMTENLNPMRQLQSQTILPENQIQYMIDLTKEYHNLLQKEESLGKQTYLWDGNVVAMTGDDCTCSDYYFQDELGSPLRLIDENGNLTDSFGYDEFGQNLYKDQCKLQMFGYTGYQYDGISETYFAQAREYRKNIGRFISKDLVKGSIIIPFSLNEYEYCWNKPMGFVDLDGRTPRYEQDILDRLRKGEWVPPSELDTVPRDKVNQALAETYGPKIEAVPQQSASQTMQITDKDVFMTSQTVEGSVSLIDAIRGSESSVGKVLGPASVAADVASGVVDNVGNGSSTGRIVSDATVDIAVSTDMAFVGILASEFATGGSIALITAFGVTGSVVPIAGTIIGIIVGISVSAYLWYKMDYQKNFEKKTMRDRLKDTQYELLTSSEMRCPSE